MMILLSFVLAMLVTTVTLPPLRAHATKLGLIDSPSAERKVHTQSTPHSGGVAIVLGALIGTIVWIPTYSDYLALFGCIAIIVLFGLLDDLYELGHRTKFLTQALACGLLVANYGGFPQVPFVPLDSAPQWLTLGFSFVFLLGVTNAVNLSDGLDGLAAGNGLLSLIVLALLSAQTGQSALFVLSLALAGGLVGFLRFNTHPASIFMGDTGSQFIGFTAAAITMLVVQTEQSPLGALVPVLIFGLPILDTLMVIGIRKWRGRPVFSADRSHLHHQLLHIGLHHYEVVIILYALQAVCIGIAYQFRFASDALVLLAYLVFCAATLGLVGAARIGGWKVHQQRTDGTQERRNLVLRKLSWYQENTARVIATLVGAMIFGAMFFQASNVSLDTAIANNVRLAAIAALVVIVCVWVLFRRNMLVVTRAACYLACPLATYSVLLGAGAPAGTRWMDLALLLLGLALALAIRLTRKSLFHLDSQDYLILLIVAITPILLPADVEGATATRIVVYLAVMLYSAEFVANKGNLTRWALTGASAVSVAMLAF